MPERIGRFYPRGGQILLAGIYLSFKVVRALGQIKDPPAGLGGHGKVQTEGIALGIGTQLAVGFVGGAAIGGYRNGVVRGFGAREIQGESYDCRLLRLGCRRQAQQQEEGGNPM